MVTAPIDRHGTFLDVGCANGLLMECVVRWAGQDGYSIEPYGVEISPSSPADGCLSGRTASLPQQRFAVIILGNKTGRWMYKTAEKAMELMLPLDTEAEARTQQSLRMSAAEKANYVGKYKRSLIPSSSELGRKAKAFHSIREENKMVDVRAINISPLRGRFPKDSNGGVMIRTSENGNR